MNLNCLFVFISTELNLKFNPFLVDNTPPPFICKVKTVYEATNNV